MYISYHLNTLKKMIFVKHTSFLRIAVKFLKALLVLSAYSCFHSSMILISKECSVGVAKI